MRFVLLQEGARWYWELRHPSGEVAARTPMTFASREAAFLSIKAVRKDAPRSLVYDPLGKLFEGV